MKYQTLLSALLVLTGLISAEKRLVTPHALVKDVSIEELIQGEKKLLGFARSYFPRNRAFGGKAHNDTVMFLYRRLKKTGAYNVYLQPQTHQYAAYNQSLIVNGKRYYSLAAQITPYGNVTGNLIQIHNLGCHLKDFPATVKGKIALIERGNCTSAVKSAHAGRSGALAAVLYNNVTGAYLSALGPPAPYVLTITIPGETGKAFVERLNKGETLRSKVSVGIKSGQRKTFNVIAETKDGNHHKVVALGAHTDSVDTGPGINDDGSGTIALLHVAEKLAKYRVKNAIRFCFWTAEEAGLLGSKYYVKHLSKADLQKIVLYLNFDMIASPNYIYSIFDGDGSRFHQKGIPPGSAQIEALFEQFFDERNISHVPTAFDGRSDYEFFFRSGIPCRGLFTGADYYKTARQARLFGGTVGIPLDPCYHAPCDDVSNLAREPFEVNTKAIAYAVANYGVDVSSIPLRG